MSKKRQQSTKFITRDILKSSVIGAFQKLDPRYMLKNPVMFVVEVGFLITLVLCFVPNLFGDVQALAGKLPAASLRTYNVIVTLILFITVLFANFAESVAEGRGKAQAETLKKTKKDTIAHLLRDDGSEMEVSASELKKGDVVIVRINELIPNDGEVIEGIASVDESAITGESAPVTREAGGDFSSVTGGTTVVSDWLKIRIAAEPGGSFLDKMIALVEGASRQKTPNEIALNTLLVGLTIIFLIVIVCLYPFAVYSGVQIPVATLVALMVCLIPTTIGGLLSAIGIAGMDRLLQRNGQFAQQMQKRFKILGAKIVDRPGKNAAETAVGHFHHSAPLRGDADADDTPVIRVGHALHIALCLQRADALAQCGQALMHGARKRGQRKSAMFLRRRAALPGHSAVVGNGHKCAKLRFAQMFARGDALPGFAHPVHQPEQLGCVVFQPLHGLPPVGFAC